MTKKSDAPAIRFKGFSDAWEQRKLGELVDRVVRKNTNNESTLPLTISAQYGLVDQITYFNNRVASRDVSNYYLVLNGEFAYNKSTSDGYPFGAVKRLDLYEKGVLSTLYIVFAPKKEQQIDSDYLTVFFDTDRWHKGVAERAAEGARNHGLLNISAEDFFDIDLSVPKDIVEQKQIGAFIRQLDNLITLHQRKFEKLTNVKKSMLEKMFPQNGSSYPEIRFKGFTDPWEQRILMVKIQVAKGSDGFRTEYLGCCTGISKSLFEIPIIGGYAAHSTQQDLGKQGIRWDAGTGRHISFCNALAKFHDAVSIILLREFLGRKVPEIIPLRLINQTDNIRMDLVIFLHEERVSKHTPTGQIPSQVQAEIVDRGVNLRAPIQPKRFMAVLPREIPVMWIILHTVIALVSGLNGFSKFFLIHNTIGRLTMVRVALYFAFPEYDPLFL